MRHSVLLVINQLLTAATAEISVLAPKECDQ
jgi:hypothetical protein